MYRLDYLIEKEDKISLGSRCKELRELTQEESQSEKEPRFSKEINLDNLAMKSNEIDANNT